jgi:hypothetical protein
VSTCNTAKAWRWTDGPMEAEPLWPLLDPEELGKEMQSMASSPYLPMVGNALVGCGEDRADQPRGARNRGGSG